MTETTPTAVETTTPPADGAAVKRERRAATPCECSLFSVQVGLRASEAGDGDLVYDKELTTGCAGELTKRTFRPGHDAKLKSLLITAGGMGEDVCKQEGAVNRVGDAVGHAEKYGFADLVRAGIEKVEAANKIKAANAARRDAAKRDAAERRAAKNAHQGLPVEPAPAPAAPEVFPTVAEVVEAETPAMVQAKVGRWVREGVIASNGDFHYTDRKDRQLVAPKGTYDLK